MSEERTSTTGNATECVDLILVVEDDEALLHLIQRHLRQAGLDCDGVGSGTEALEWLQSRIPRLVLLDYSLPDMLGEELLEEFDKRGIEVPFIVATGHGSETVAVEMMKRGARDYLIKGGAFLGLLPAVIGQTLSALAKEIRLAEAEEELRRAHAELEVRVEQRTAQLAEANAQLRVEMEERLRAEKQARTHEAELAHVDRVNTMGEMVAELAHELNQPLAAIASYAQASSRMLLDRAGDDNTEVRSAMSQIAEQAHRAGGIIHRLRRFISKAQPTRRMVDLNTLVKEITVLAEVKSRAAEVEILFKLDDDVSHVMVDQIQIEQVLLNLLHNAFEAMSDSETGSRCVVIHTSNTDDGRVSVAVEDRGTGIPSNEIDQIFDRFYTTKANGMGMGLPICRSIIQSHGGQMWAVPNEYGGMTFNFDLPIHQGSFPSEH